MLKCGDVVIDAARQLPRMTIDQVDADMCETVWFEGTTLHRGVFSISALMIDEAEGHGKATVAARPTLTPCQRLRVAVGADPRPCPEDRQLPLPAMPAPRPTDASD